jgi:hypothetical protein
MPCPSLERYFFFKFAIRNKDKNPMNVGTRATAIQYAHSTFRHKKNCAIIFAALEKD